jgi:hypothetical protein
VEAHQHISTSAHRALLIDESTVQISRQRTANVGRINEIGGNYQTQKKGKLE